MYGYKRIGGCHACTDFPDFFERRLGVHCPHIERYALFPHLGAKLIVALQVLHAGSVSSGMWRVWDTRVSIARSLKGETELVVRSDRKGLNDIAVSPNGRYAAIVPDNGVVLLYEMNWKYEIEAEKNKIMNGFFSAFSGGRRKR